MQCLINDTISYLVKQGKRASAIRTYLHDKYRITIDMASIRKRIEYLKDRPESGLTG
ncbi:MAG: hypothetical protein P8X57_01210 [Cyclobacteriaceae bacterium]